MSGGHEACSPHLSALTLAALTLVMVACLRDHEVEQIGVCGSPLGGLERGSEDRERQAATVLHSPWSQGRIARRKSDRRSSLGIGVRDYMEPGGHHDALDLVLARRLLAAGR